MMSSTLSASQSWEACSRTYSAANTTMQDDDFNIPEAFLYFIIPAIFTIGCISILFLG